MNHRQHVSPVAAAAAVVLSLGVVSGALGQTPAPVAPPAPVAAPPADAAPQAPAVADALPSPDPEIHATFNLFGRYDASADFHAGRGSLSTARGGGALGVKIPLGEGRSIGLSFSGEYSNYDFNNASTFPGTPAKGPWTDVTILSVGVNYAAKINSHWGYFVGVSGAASWERGADFDRSLTIAGAGGATYAFSDDLRMGFGLAGGSRLEDNAYVVPIVTVDWKIDDKWSLGTNAGLGNRAIGLQLGYQVTDTLMLSISGGFEYREFRLDRSGPVPNGVGSDYRLPILLAAHWQVDPQVKLTLGLGVNGWSRLRAENSNGDRLAQEELSPGFVVGGGVEFKF